MNDPQFLFVILAYVFSFIFCALFVLWTRIKWNREDYDIDRQELEKWKQKIESRLDNGR